ncbi:MAG TPA: hypothetical protein VK699_15040 [Terriglobales bacterium]|nr:hypothetical protein [Terriglobales bacterium]
MFKKSLLLLSLLFALVTGAVGWAQAGDDKNAQIKINYLNVCSPSDTEKQELGAALGRLPAKIHFAPDFEVSRGRTTMTEPPEALGSVLGGSQVVNNDNGPSNWVRIRREFPAESPFVSVQYSMSVDAGGIVETLVFRSREMKDVIQVSMEDKVSAGDPAQVLKSDTPVDRVRIERFGKSSVALARCQGADQHAYDALFQQASGILSRYRAALNVRTTVPADLRRLGVGGTKDPEAKEKSTKPAQPPADKKP